jgi:hypothetical protein
MKRHTFIKSVASVLAFSVLPSFAKGAAYVSGVYIPKGTEIREIGTNDLIVVTARDIMRGEGAMLDQFDWVWPKPITGTVVSSSISKACEVAAFEYSKRNPNSEIYKL